ncbi:uncharacterized protein LOC133307990 [Gastrolobium bilobum]|uniref:uncharacterized protein LOC133307990 n=1 Tax=Gastrolobium bilobum TaxID=150636 RepID=UPI002AB16E19|nr:uncharacterized protein LOC133307990 [Gastrolobium bilobum]
MAVLKIAESTADKVDRPVSTSIYFLLPSGNVSRLHRIPCVETWHHYIGEPITIVELNKKDGSVKFTCLGSDLSDYHIPQYTVASNVNVWFGSFPTKDFSVVSSYGALVRAAARDGESHYSLVGCTCAPAFQFQDFELAKRSQLIARFPQMEPLITVQPNQAIYPGFFKQGFKRGKKRNRGF